MRINDVDLDLGPRQQRHVLAILAAEAGRHVTTEALIDRVWVAAPPAARRIVHAHITRIRRLLEQTDRDGETGARILRHAGGYRLDLDPDRVDIHRLRRLTACARVTDDDDERARLLRDAVALWRGTPFAGLYGSWATQTRESCRRQYLDVVVEWAATELRLSRPHAVIAVLGDLGTEFPLAEPLAAAMLRALCAARRPAEAVEHYVAFRTRLADELGVDPSVELRSVYEAILRGDLDQPSGTAVAADMNRVSAHVPADVPAFAGQLDHLVMAGQDGRSIDGRTVPPAPAPYLIERPRVLAALASASERRVTALTAGPGFGKTTALAQWAASRPCGLVHGHRVRP